MFLLVGTTGLHVFKKATMRLIPLPRKDNKLMFCMTPVGEVEGVGEQTE